jgi:nitrite reductase (NADH) small subunit
MTAWITIGRLDDIPRLGARIIRTSGGDIAVFRTADDRIFALDDRCPHKGGPLSQGIVHGDRVTCPLHNWQIGLADGIAITPDEGCVAAHAVRVEDGAIALCLGHGAIQAA